MGCKKYSIQLKKFRGEGKRTVPMVTYTILHDFTTCDPCHVFNKTMTIIFDISYFQEEQKNEHYLNKRSFDKNTLLPNIIYIYIIFWIWIEERQSLLNCRWNTMEIQLKRRIIEIYAESATRHWPSRGKIVESYIVLHSKMSSVFSLNEVRNSRQWT